MNREENIQRLLSADIDYTKIASVIYETSLTFDPQGDEISFYRVVCHASYETGSFVRTELWLPENWNGVFIGLGNGGIGGEFWYSDLLQYTQLGYATSQTDLGTSLGMESGIHNPAVWKDFGWRATHGTTVISKQLIELHYGKAPSHSYFWGISTGGQQAMSEAQRFPEDYDGIIAGVPANNRIALHTYFLWCHNRLRQPDGSALFQDPDIDRLSACAVEYFQAQGDGQPGDNFITYPYRDEHTIPGFLDYLKKQGFTDAQIETMKALYEGPVDPATGRQIYNGAPLGSETYDNGLRALLLPDNPNFYPFYWTFGKDFDITSFDFNRDYRKLRDTLSADMDANVTDLRPFLERGGKLIAFSGSADPCVPFPDAQKYYERVMDEMGGYEKTASFFRYFLFPGKDHVSGGAGANREWGDTLGECSLIDVVRSWHETGTAPECLIAARVKPEHLSDRRIAENDILFAREIYPYGSAKNPVRDCGKTCEIF